MADAAAQVRIVEHPTSNNQRSDCVTLHRRLPDDTSAAGTMKALVKFAPGDGHVDVREVEEPRCGADQVKIEIAFCGVCGTDLHVLHDTFRNYPPVILGHELSGTVVEAGAQAGVPIGQRVAVLGATSVTCGACAHCESGYFIFCRTRRGMGHGVNGGFARYVVARPDQLYVVPDHMSLEEAALSEPFAAVVQAVVEIARVRPGETAVVSGPGPMGLLCVKLLAAEGVTTIAAGTAADAERLEAARRFGAVAVASDAAVLAEAVLAHTGGAGVDATFDCAGHPLSIRACLDALRPMGRHVQVGICGQDVVFPMDQVFYKQLTVTGSICYTARTWARMFEIFAEGRLTLRDLVSHVLPITDWRTAFDLCLERKALKVLMYPVR
jgi:L-iditol 2-dehydrogenase